jgi:hypothetical protein
MVFASSLVQPMETSDLKLKPKAFEKEICCENQESESLRAHPKMKVQFWKICRYRVLPTQDRT